MSSRSSRPASTFVEALTPDDDDLAWVEQYCRHRGNEYLTEVTEDFLLDKFNLTHIGMDSVRFQEAYDLITDNYYEDEIDEEGKASSIYTAAKQLYGAIHQRFIQTPQGLAQIHKKYQNKVFGSCPRVLCEGQPLLPVGLSDKFGQDTTKLYCMRCEDIYLPKSSAHASMDGAHFGTSLPQLYIMSYKIELPPYEERVIKYVPRVFGFQVADPELVALIDQKEANAAVAAAAGSTATLPTMQQ